MLSILLLVMSLNSAADDLVASVRFWQRQMALGAWRISVEIVSRSQLTDRTVGHIDIDVPTRTAVIRVLDHRESDLPVNQARADQLLTIAHEMVHLKRLVRDQSPDWNDEPTTNEQTFMLLREHRRWIELSVAEE